ncbi:hypothetical protein L207DRAFT_525476 [Hyaloscypha variabilis F]|uniref:Uncharacterized protein n=1 Tax=Hyaloscypha variabilis (strain UAMH 11265 / GT02V1 / F) TaxID=1149755 RepID=A0A2J6S043_HYAVF|nr:hypothetical protein L207DRAFT_525476 [Hyaloscypha variabilis F]
MAREGTTSGSNLKTLIERAVVSERQRRAALREQTQARFDNQLPHEDFLEDNEVYNDKLRAKRRQTTRRRHVQSAEYTKKTQAATLNENDLLHSYQTQELLTKEYDEFRERHNTLKESYKTTKKELALAKHFVKKVDSRANAAISEYEIENNRLKEANNILLKEMSTMKSSSMSLKDVEKLKAKHKLEVRRASEEAANGPSKQESSDVLLEPQKIRASRRNGDLELWSVNAKLSLDEDGNITTDGPNCDPELKILAWEIMRRTSPYDEAMKLYIYGPVKKDLDRVEYPFPAKYKEASNWEIIKEYHQRYRRDGKLELPLPRSGAASKRHDVLAILQSHPYYMDQDLRDRLAIAQDRVKLFDRRYTFQVGQLTGVKLRRFLVNTTNKVLRIGGTAVTLAIQALHVGSYNRQELCEKNEEIWREFVIPES